MGVSPLKYHSCRDPTSSFSSAMKPSTDTTLCMITVPTAAPRVCLRVSDDLGAARPRRACRKSLGGHRTVVRRKARLGREPAPQCQVGGRSVAGEVPELLAEVRLIEVTRSVGELR